MHRYEARVWPVLQSLVCWEVPQGGQFQRPVHRPLQALPAVCSESNKREGDSYWRTGVHGPWQRKAWKLFLTLTVTLKMDSLNKEIEHSGFCEGCEDGHWFNEFRNECFYFLLLDVFFSLVKDDEPSLCFGMISHLLWHCAGTQCAKTEFLGIMVAIFHLGSALNIPFM